MRPMILSSKRGQYTFELEPVERWEVRFETPLGTFERIEDAARACEANDFDPAVAIAPVAWAISEHGEAHVAFVKYK